MPKTRAGRAAVCAAARRGTATESPRAREAEDGVDLLFSQMQAALLAASVLGCTLPGRILTFGDSLTAGLIGNTRDQYSPYAATLASRLANGGLLR